MRIPDLPAFIRHIASALEQRLVSSALEGYTGELCIDFYRSGLRLVFNQGKLIAADDLRKPAWGFDETQ